MSRDEDVRRLAGERGQERINSGNTHLVALLEDFEKSFDSYVRTQDSNALKTIANVSNYVERPASATRGTPGARFKRLVGTSCIDERGAQRGSAIRIGV